MVGSGFAQEIQDPTGTGYTEVNYALLLSGKISISIRFNIGIEPTGDNDCI
jgi:hypothetical protein